MKLLDTTLRDGSYVNNFSFDKSDTINVLNGLNSVNVDYIEIGHGVGLGGYRVYGGKDTLTDNGYIEAAIESEANNWGMFAIPGICEMADLKNAIAHNIGFLRLGGTINDLSLLLRFLDAAKENDTFVCVNFMKSYIYSPLEFEIAAREVADAGADLVYIVDSAGAMLPNQVRQYCERLGGVTFGFHGHENLGLGVANSLVALECGADVIDTSMQRLGRSSGNTSTEQFVAVCQKHYQKLLHISLLDLLKFSEQYAMPFVSTQGISSVDTIFGLSGFHSSYYAEVKDYCRQHELDISQFILELCKLTLDRPSQLHLEQAGSKCSKARSGQKVVSYVGGEQNGL